MSGPWTDFAPASTAGPWIDFAPASADYGIDFTKPIPEVRAAIAKLPEGDRKKATDQWAAAFVAKERQGAGAGADVVRNFARGVPGIGSWLDEANASTMGALHSVSGGLLGAPYDETLAYQRATDKAADAEAAKVGTLPLIGDVSTAGLTKFAGGLASAPVLPVARLMQGSSILPSAVNMGATGAGYGLLQGAGEGETASQRMSHAGIGAAAGGLLGAGLPVVAKGAVNSVAGLADAMRSTPAALQGFHPGAVARVGRAAADDQLSLGAINQRVGALGPEAMLADLGANLTGQAGAIASNPGAGQTLVRRMLQARSDGATSRIRDTATEQLGMPQNMVALEADTLKASREAAKPLYEQFYSTEVNFTPELRSLLQRADALGAVKQAEKLMAAEGIDPASLGANGRLIDLVKRGVDDVARAAPPGSNLQRITSGLARDIRDATDKLLSPNDPARSPWALARAASGEGKSMTEAAQYGQEVFKRNTNPDQMRFDMQGMTPPEISMMQAGGRGAIRDIMGRAPNGDGAIRRELGSDFAQEKLRLLAGPDAERAIMSRIDAENTFAGTKNAVTGNSLTAARTAAQKEFPSPFADKPTVPDGMWGDAKRVARMVVNSVSGGYVRERNAKIASDAAEMLVAQGVRRDVIAQAIMDHAKSRALSDKAKDAATRQAMHVLMGGRGLATDRAIREFGAAAQ